MAAEFGAVFDLVTSPGRTAWRRSASPVWLWSPSAASVRWANGAALTLWDAHNFESIAAAADADRQPGLARLARIAGTLPRGSGRIERLRLFLGGKAMNLTCHCELVFTDAERLVAVTVLDRMPGVKMPGNDGRNLLQSLGAPAIAATPDGQILYANPQAGESVYAGLGALVADLGKGDPRSGEIVRDGEHVEARATLVDTVAAVLIGAAVTEPMVAATPASGWVRDADDAPAAEAEEPAATEVIFNPAWDDGSGAEPQAVPKDEAPPQEAPDEDNVLPFRGHGVTQDTDDPAPAEDGSAPLAAHERDAFRHLAQALGARMEGDETPRETGAAATEAEPEAAPTDTDATAAEETTQPVPASAPATQPPAVGDLEAGDAQMLLSRLPLGILIYRQATALYANRAFLEMFGVADFTELTQAGDVSRLMPRLEADDAALLDHGKGEQGVRPALLVARDLAGRAMRVVARLQAVRWHGEPAMLLSVRPPDGQLAQVETDIEDSAEGTAGPAQHDDDAARERELETIVGLATDGVAILDEDGNVTLLDRQAEKLFGADTAATAGKAFTELFAQDSRIAIAAYLDGIRGLSVPSLVGKGRRVTARGASGADMPLHLVMGRLSDDPERRYCAVLRDITQSLKIEADLTKARKRAETTSQQKSEFIARVSHELRTPLNSIMGFSEVILEERFGALGNERYLDYVRDIHASGEHVLGLVNDLLDLSRVEAGKLELNFTSVDVNEVAVESVRLMLQEAARGRVIVRSSLGRRLPAVVADHRSLRQILLNLLSNAIKFTLPGGQVVLSTRLTESGEVQIRVRDTGIGMEEQDIAVAMEPFQQVATAPAPRTPGAGLGLPLTKALAHANRSLFRIESRAGSGTLTEITFPPRKVLAI